MTRHPAHALATFLVVLLLLVTIGQLISDAAAELRPAATAMEGE